MQTETDRDKSDQINSKVSLREQLSFYIPLILTSILMMSTHSLFNAALARLPSPAIYLSAYAVSKSVLSVLKSPMVMVRQTVSALVTDKQSYHKVKKFIMAGVTVVVLLLAVVSLTSIGHWIFKSIMGLRGESLAKAVIILRVFIFFPVVSTLKNFMHGISIKYEITPIFTVATIFRVIYVMSIVIFVDKIVAYIPASIIAGLLFLGALAVEGAVMWIGVKLVVGDIAGNLDQIRQEKPDIADENPQNNMSYKMILLFFYPLAITSIMKFMTNPIINMGLARTVRPEIAISAFAVGWYLGLIFMSPLFMFHQVPINFIGYRGHSNLKEIKRFGVIIGIFLTLIFLIVGFTDIGYYLTRDVIGATEEISKLAVDVLKIMIIYPLIRVVLEYYWGILMKNQMTKYISIGKLVGLVVLAVFVVILTMIGLPNPAAIGIIGFIISQIVEVLYLYIIARKSKVRSLFEE